MLVADLSSYEPLAAASSTDDDRARLLAAGLSRLGLGGGSTVGGQATTEPPVGQALLDDGVDEGRSRRSANMTECVTVPSSEHVAEIVGRQGCKIKALRAKTNTYIKTPARGDEPVFVITGRREDVSAAKQEILSAAEHFSQIRASRRAAATTNSAPTRPTTSTQASGATSGQVTCEVRVPVRSVGLVVGPKGSTVKRIQQLTQTYIVTPSRGTDPVFEVVGSPDNVERARKEIESRVQQQRGGVGGGNSAIRCSGMSSGADLPGLSSAGMVGCWKNPASSSSASTSLGFPELMMSGERSGVQTDSLPLVDVWNRGLRSSGGGGGLRSGFTDLLSSLGGGLGLLNESASLQATSTLDGDEGIGSLSPDPLVFDGSPWSRTSAGLTAALQAAETTSTSSRRSWMDMDFSASAGLEVGGRLAGTVLDWNTSAGSSSGVGPSRYADSSSESPSDCVSVTPPRSPMACLFG